jgi:hypothetical protein
MDNIIAKFKENKHIIKAIKKEQFNNNEYKELLDVLVYAMMQHCNYEPNKLITFFGYTIYENDILFCENKIVDTILKILYIYDTDKFQNITMLYDFILRYIQYIKHDNSIVVPKIHDIILFLNSTIYVEDHNRIDLLKWVLSLFRTKLNVRDQIYLLDFILNSCDLCESNPNNIHDTIDIYTHNFDLSTSQILSCIDKSILTYENILRIYVIFDKYGISEKDIYYDKEEVDNILINRLIQRKCENYKRCIGKFCRMKRLIHYDIFTYICKYDTTLLTKLIKNNYELYNDICDVYVENNRDDDISILLKLINSGYYYDKNTYHLALKSGNKNCAKLLKIKLF